MAGIQKTGFIGAGNVATHLATALSAEGIEVTAIANRSIESARELAATVGAVAVTDLKELAELPLDLIIIAVPDNAIRDVAGQLGATLAAVVHTSGAAASDLLTFPGRKTGVFYPLQTLTRGNPVNMAAVPLCVHSEDDQLLISLRELASRISKLVYDVNDEQRRWLHLAAVFINNNVNHLLARVEDLITARSMDRNILSPLLKETIRKAGSAHPGTHQTGPAIRGDESTKAIHLELLREFGDDRLIELYNYFWRSIQQYNSDDIPGKS